jgi:hypothetical protein
LCCERRDLLILRLPTQLLHFQVNVELKLAFPDRPSRRLRVRVG